MTNSHRNTLRGFSADPLPLNRAIAAALDQMDADAKTIAELRRQLVDERQRVSLARSQPEGAEAPPAVRSTGNL